MRLRIGKPKFGQGPASSLIETFSIGAAVDITFTPTGNISANNVQAAIVELDNEKVAKAGDTMTGFLTLSAAPTASSHAATKQYVDDNVVVGGASITYVDDENTAQDVITATKVSKAGDTMSGLLILSGNPTGNFHAATKEYVDNTASDYADTTTLYVDTENTAQDAIINTKVDRAGDALTGFLTLHADPTIDTHAATKKYVDDNIGSGSGTAVATIADAPPSSPVQGQLWFESDTGLMYIYFDDGTSTQWVPVTTSAYIPTLTIGTPVLDLTSGATDFTPDFTLTGDLVLDDTVFFEYSTASDFTGASSLSNTIDAAEDSANSISFSTGTLAAGTWYFRAKIQRTGYVDSGWSNTETITLVSAYTGPGDLVSGAAGWWGLRAYNAAYCTGSNPCIDIVDQAGANLLTVNILTDGTLDTAAIAAWVTTHGVSVIQVAKVYDQSGGSLPDLPGVPGFLPRLTLSASGLGSGKATFDFFGADPSFFAAFESAANVAFDQPYSTSVVASVDGTDFTFVWGSNPSNAHYGGYRTTGFVSSSGGAELVGDAASAVDFHAVQMTVNDDGTGSVYTDGTDETGTVGTTDFTSTPVRLGGGAGAVMSGRICEFGIWPGVFSSGNKSDLNGNQTAYWGF